jgi:hypothetical protein
MAGPFRIIKKLDKSKKAVKLLLSTSSGPKEIWSPKSLTSIYRYEEDGEIILEAWISERIAKRAGLIDG